VKKVQNKVSLKSAFLCGISVLALTAVLDVANATEINDGDLITADDPTTLEETNETGSVNITIDSSGGGISLGTLNSRAVEMFNGAGGTNLTINIETSGAANGVSFNGEIESPGHADDTITINIINDDVTFGAGVSTLNLNDADINIGSDSADPTLTVTFDAATNNNFSTNANIDAVDEADNVTLAITNSEGTPFNLHGFDGDIGSEVALDAITVAANMRVEFRGTVNADLITISTDGGNSTDFEGAVTANVVVDGDGIIAFDADLTGNLDLEADASVYFEADRKIIGDLDNTTGGATGTVTFNQSASDITLVSGNIGETQAIGQVGVSTGAGLTSTFAGTVNANYFRVRGNGTVVLSEDISVADRLEIEVSATANIAANKKVIGDVEGNGVGQGTLTFETTTSDTTLVSGTVGALRDLSVINVDPDAGVTATFAGTVNSNTINHTGIGTVAFSDDVTGNVNIENGTVDFSGDVTGNVAINDGGTVTVAATKSITGTVDNTSGADGAGRLTINNTGGNLTVVSGNVGGTNSLHTVTVDNTGGDAQFGGTLNTVNVIANGGNAVIVATGARITTLTADGDFIGGGGTLDVNRTINITDGGSLIAGAGGMALGGVTINAPITLDAGNNVTFDGTNLQTVTGQIDGGGHLTVSNTLGVTFASAVGSNTALDRITVGATHKATFNRTLNAADIDLDGELEVNDAVVLSGDLNIDGASIRLRGGFESGDTIFTVNDVVSANSTEIILPTSFTSGTIVFADSGVNASGDIANLTVTDTVFAEYTLVANGNDIEIAAAAKSDDEIATALDLSSQEVDILKKTNEILDGSGDEEAIDALTDILLAGGNTATDGVKQISVQGDTLSGVTETGIGTGSTVINLSITRLAELRSGIQYAVASNGEIGESAPTKGAWMQAFGNWIDQDGSNGVSGFDARTYGVAFGLDNKLSDRVTVGGSFAYANSNVDGDGAGQSEADINSYQFTLYGDYTTDQYYVEGMLGYARNHNDVSRIVNFGGLDRVASGDYASNQFMASIDGGLPIQLRGTAYFTPTAGLAWTYVSSDSYTETGSGGLNQRVDIDDVNTVIGSLGAKLHTRIRAKGGYIVPEIKAGVSYDFVGDDVTATSRFVAGGAAFKVEGTEVEQLGANAGFGLAYEAEEWTLGMNYDAEFKSDSIGYSGRVEARFKF